MMSKLLQEKPSSFFPFFQESDLLQFFPSQLKEESGLSIYEDEKTVTIEASLPGLSTEQIEITFEKGTLWVKGNKKEGQQDKERNYYRQSSRSYSYRVAVPGHIDETKEPTAQYQDGLVIVKFAKLEQKQPKKIPISL